ncbi:hypothetical protein HK405_000096, partial [Cladochytrium tenue]
GTASAGSGSRTNLATARDDGRENAKRTEPDGGTDSGGGHAFLPTMRVVATAARWAELGWAWDDDAGGIAEEDDDGSGLEVQVVRAEAGDPQFAVAYEGAAARGGFVLEGLRPETAYVVRLRVRRRDEAPNGGGFSAEYAEATFRTGDETEIGRAEQTLVRAVTEGDEATVVSVLARHGHELNLEVRDRQGRTMLMVACQRGSAAIATALLQAGADANARTASGKTALALAAAGGWAAAVRAVLAHCESRGAAVARRAANAADAGGSTPLMRAAEAAGAGPAAGAPWGGGSGVGAGAAGAGTGSTSAAVAEIVVMLVRAGAEVGAEDMSGRTALDRVCTSSGDVRVVRALLESGARVVNSCGSGGHSSHGGHGGGRPRTRRATTLMSAAVNGHAGLVEELVDRWHADVCAETEYGETA